jgi:pimeloyl-ACP methyl ester carboxylesterase/DNA-binding CsgD family transcriptional regulator
MAVHRPERRIRYAKSGGFNVAYQVLGDGPIDLILSPGWVTHLELAWDIPPLAGFLQHLATFSRLILFDKKGTGLSDRLDPDTLPSLELRMDDIRAVLDAVGSERAALFGTLGGGAMCGLFAATHPERCLALILYGTFAKLEPYTGLLSRLADNQESALDRIEREWGTEGVGVAFWAPSLVDDERVKSVYLRLTRSGVSPGSARSLMKLGYQIDWNATLPDIHIPTLVLHRTGDLVVPVRQGRELAQGIAGARYAELSGVDHLMWVGDQDAIFREVEAFLQHLAPSREQPPTSPEEVGLSARELEVLRLVAAGLTNKQIAGILFISPKTAGVHVSSILTKLGVERRAGVATVAQQLGLIPTSTRP